MGSFGSQSSSGKSMSGPPKWMKQYGKEYLLPFMQEKGTSESPYYPQLSGMYQGMLNEANLGVTPEVSKTIQEMVTTGSPYDTSKAYAEARPAYEKDLVNAIAQAKESAGMGGGLRGSTGEIYLGRAAADTTADFNKWLAELAARGYESAQGRRMAAVPMSIEAGNLPMQRMSALQELAKATVKSQYPWLDTATQFFSGSPNVSFGSQSSGGSQFQFNPMQAILSGLLLAG